MLVLRSDGASRHPARGWGCARLPCLGGRGGAAPGHPQFPSRLSSLEMQGAVISLGPEFVRCPWAAESGPHWSPASLWGPPALLLPPSLSTAGCTASRSPCQPPGQTGLAGCPSAGGAVTQLLPGPGQTALTKLQSAKLQSEDLNQANLHPAKRRTVLGRVGGGCPHPRSCPTRGSGGSRGPLYVASGGRGSVLSLWPLSYPACGLPVPGVRALWPPPRPPGLPQCCPAPQGGQLPCL